MSGDSRDSLFTKHLTMVECDNWRDSDRPTMERLISAAFCHRRANGHSRFDPGELREALGIDRRTLTALIERAVIDGRLAAGSCANCLILLGVTGGAGGSPRARCAVRDQHARIAPSHIEKLDGAVLTRAQRQAERAARRRLAEEEYMRTVRMEAVVTDEEWEAVLAVRAEKAAQARRAEMRLIEERRSQGKLEGPEGRK